MHESDKILTAKERINCQREISVLFRTLLLSLVLSLPTAASASAFYGVCQRISDSKLAEKDASRKKKDDYRFYFCSCLQMKAMNTWGIRTTRSQLHASQWLNTHYGKAGKNSCKSYAMNKMGSNRSKKQDANRQLLSML